VAAIALFLAGVALFAGIVAGALAGFRGAGKVRFGAAFLVYLGLLAAAATTRAQTMEVLPLALVYGAGTGALPFAGGFFAVRWAVTRLRARRRAEVAGPR
jgi:hypothetical protein